MPRRALCLVASFLGLLLGIPSGAAATEVRPFGGAPAHGAAPTTTGAHRIVGVVATPSGQGYWQFSAAGAVFPFGDARSFGPASTVAANKPIVGMAATPTGAGYWLVSAAGGIFSFGDARYLGSTGAMRLNQPIVGMAATPSGGGYWLVASDGGIFSFGDARFAGSTGAMRLNRPIVGMAATATGGGYWLVASDGGIFTFGDAVFHGSAGGMGLPEPVVGMTTSAGGYLLATLDGRVLPFGPAVASGSLADACKAEPVVGITSNGGTGYWLGTSNFLPAQIPAGTHPIDVVAAESANMRRLLGLRQGCQGTAAERRGHLSSPLPGSVQTSSYGQRTHPIYRRPQFHAGIDLAGGSRILAAADGVVVQVASRQGYGLTTIVDHGDGVGTVYAHQAASAVRAGDRVRRGQAIGTVGRSGNVTGAHLHFEVRLHGAPRDPRAWW